MNGFIAIFNSLVANSTKQVSDFITGWGPKLFFAAAVILAGWLFAFLIKKIVSKLLKALGFNVLSEKLGLKKFLEKGGIKKTPSLIAGIIVYWLIIFNTLMLVSDALNISVVARFFSNIFLHIPNIIIVLILISLGIIMGKFANNFTGKAARLAGIPFDKLIGILSGYLFVGLAVLLSFDYLNISRVLFIQISIIILGMIPLVISLLLIIGGKNTISCILASRYLQKELAAGEIIEIGGITGKVVEVGVFSTTLEEKNREIIIPNSRFMEQTLTKIRPHS